MPAQVHGTRNAGTTNIPNPVAIPKGGMMIFFAVTAVRDSRTRQTMTAIAPMTEVISDITLRKGIVMKSSSKAKCLYPF
jgi:inosine-uridine nucleoside N-ribohydrolase